MKTNKYLASDWEEALLENQERDEEEAIFDDFRRADREEAMYWVEEKGKV